MYMENDGRQTVLIVDDSLLILQSDKTGTEGGRHQYL